MNELLKDNFGTLHNTYPFDRITLADYEQAIMQGMQEEDEAISQIVNNPDEPTFRNVILPKTDKLLSRATNAFFNLLSANTNDEMDEMAQRISPLLAEHSNKILLNSTLFEKVKYVKEHETSLSAEEKMLLDKVYEGFERNGACLNEEDKEKLAHLNIELSQLTILFSQNNLKEMNAYQLHITDERDLSGLPQTALDAARMAAIEKGLEGHLFTLHAPSYGPFITYADNRDLRRQIYQAKACLCSQDNEYDNREIVRQIVNHRTQIAQLLGYQTYADYALTRRMAQTTANVYDLIEQLLAAYKPIALEEMDELRTLARQIEGENFVLEPWDLAYYSHKLKLNRYNLDSEMLRPYFQLEKVKEGIFSLANRLYGITFRQNKEIPVYHPDVEAYEVFDRDGTYLAVFYADFFPRESKQSGAWMTSYQEQYINEEGNDIRPHVSITTNFTKPTEEKPSLLTLSEVETFLHEFGHALHGIFSKVRFESLSGTNVYWDFVELPSQFMENYATQPDFLHTFAYHYETGEPIPDELIRRIKESSNFQCGYACVRQLSFCLLDMAYYTLTTPLNEDILQFETQAWKEATLIKPIKGACMTVQFGHIMSGGYAAGYYSYKWAEVLDADAFSMFQQEGIFNLETANRFRQEILSKGGTRHPMDLYVSFRGQKPTIDALLTRNGLKK